MEIQKHETEPNIYDPFRLCRGCYIPNSVKTGYPLLILSDHIVRLFSLHYTVPMYFAYPHWFFVVSDRADKRDKLPI